MAELTLTSWLDPVFSYFASESGIPVADYTAVAGAQGIGASVEIVSDLFLQPLLGKLLQGVIGAATAAYGIWGKPSVRLRKELITLGQQMMTRLIDPIPSQIIELRKNIAALVAGLKARNMAMVTSALLRSPAELTGMLKVLGVPVTNPNMAPPGRLDVPRIPAIPGVPAPSERLAGFPFLSPVQPPAAAFAPPQYTLDGVELGKGEAILSPKYTLNSYHR